MSKEYEGQDPLEIAKQAERDLNTQPSKSATAADSTAVCFFTFIFACPGARMCIDNRDRNLASTKPSRTSSPVRR